jgi:flavin-dependent dehydrogenase
MNEGVLIVGAGVAGSYLYRLLADKGMRVTICDTGLGRAKCGVHPCGFAVSGEFRDLAKKAGLDPQDYVTRQDRYVLVDGVRTKSDVLAIDKPRLLASLLEGADVLPNVPTSDYELVVDATGVARAIGTPIPNDLIGNTFQVRIRVEDRIRHPTFRFHSGVGYVWVIPLNDTEAHVGCGALLMERPKLRAFVHRMLSEEIGEHEVICSCTSKIRVTGPVSFQSLAEGNIVHVGEAAGLVGPTSGAGNVPAMISAAFLASSPETYADKVRYFFSPVKAEANLIRRMVNGGMPRITDAFKLRAALNRVGIYPSLLELVKIVKRLRTRLRDAHDIVGPSQGILQDPRKRSDLELAR